jgi:hypothetical protein
MVRRALGLVALLALGAGTMRAQTACAATSAGCALGPGERPDVRPERVAGEIVGGTYAGIAGYFVGRGVGTIATAMMSERDDALRDRIVNGAGVVGAGFAIASTVYGIGNIGAETGSYAKTLGGVGIGTAASLIVSHLVFQGRIPADKWSARRKWWVATLECSLPAIGGTIAFNRSRRWQR